LNSADRKEGGTATTRLSPYQFKILVKQVSTSLEAWEDVFGNIPVTLPEIKKEAIVEALANMKTLISVNAGLRRCHRDRP
jgi:hypothetical protein